MTRMIKVMMFAVLLVIGMASGAYAAKGTFDGDFQGGSQDKYTLECSNVGKMSVHVKDAGPSKDNSFGVTLTCEETGEEDTGVADPGGKTEATVRQCSAIKIAIFCDGGNCDDDYRASFTCKGSVDRFSQQQNN